MKTRAALEWFKTSFNKQLEDAAMRTPFSVDMLTAIAYQENGEVWPLRGSVALSKIADQLRMISIADVLHRK